MQIQTLKASDRILVFQLTVTWKPFTSAPHRWRSKCLPTGGTSFHNPLGYWPHRMERHSPQLTICTRGWWHQAFRPPARQRKSAWTFAVDGVTVSSDSFTAGLCLACQDNIDTALCWNIYDDKLNVRLPFSFVRARAFPCVEWTKWMFPGKGTSGCEAICFSIIFLTFLNSSNTHTNLPNTLRDVIYMPSLFSSNPAQAFAWHHGWDFAGIVAVAMFRLVKLSPDKLAIS